MPRALPKLRRKQRGIYVLGAYEIWNEKPGMWSVWPADPNGGVLDVFRTLREAKREWLKQIALERE